MKECTLFNGRFNWYLIVDNQKISFQGRHNAEYFAEHYKELGYDIKWEKEEVH